MGTDLHGLPLRKALVLLVNLASTVLTLMAGLRENPLIVLVTGRYDEMRARLIDRRINSSTTTSFETTSWTSTGC
jgi:hypothetical protein